MLKRMRCQPSASRHANAAPTRPLPLLQRWNLYTVFLCIPTGLLKALASKTVTLDDPTLDHAAAQAEAAETAGDAAGTVMFGISASNKGVGSGGSVTGAGPGAAAAADASVGASVTPRRSSKMFPASLRLSGDESMLAPLRMGLARLLRCCRPGSSVAPGPPMLSRKKLLRSHLAAVWMSWPFLAWGECEWPLRRAPASAQLPLQTS